MKKNRPPDAAELRRQAEERLVGREPEGPAGFDEEARRLVHELGVHQVELEIQNEELRSSRQEVESALARYTELFEFAPIGYFSISGDESIQDANLAAARLLGLPRSKVIGRRFSSFLRAEHYQAFRDFLARVLVEGGADEPMSESCELAAGEEGGERRELHLTAAAHQGPPLTALVAAEDVTRRVRAEAMLRAESRNKDAFLANLSHELRNPLAPIHNSLFVLGRAQAGSPRARSAQAVLDRQVAQLTRIVDDLLDVTRITRGKVRLERKSMDLRELARRTAEDHRASFEASGIRLSTTFDAEPLWVHADSSRLVQVMGNLLGNAVKFTPRGGKVEIGLRREGLSARLSVRDSGAGIAPELRERLFEPFSQGTQTLERARGGLGLGLAMVKGLVELHDGTVEVASDGPGRGSEFTVHLPLERATPAAPPPERKQTARTHRVLVIEDRADVAQSLAGALESAGHSVRLARSGPAGFALASSFQPEIVLCRLELAEKEGFNVARAFRAALLADRRRSLLVAVGGLAPAESARCALEAGFDRHVAATPSPEGLERLLAETPEAQAGEGASFLL
jgi:PAS domain S-box-containing protein